MDLSRRIGLLVIAFATVFTGQSVLTATSAFAVEPVIAVEFSSVSVANRGVVSAAPASVAGANMIHVCGVTSGGGLKCWGDGDGHALGDGTANDHPIAFPVIASGVAQVESARTFTCARMTDATVKCWGDGSQSHNALPTPVKLNSTETPLIGVAEISVGSVHACAVIVANGGVKCWGNNVVHQIGDGTATGDNATDVRTYPTSVLDPDDPAHLAPLTGVADISSAGGNTCARKSSGAVVCWGDNSAGQLGNGSTSVQNFPVHVSGIASGALQISTGRQHSCAVLALGELRCWGENTQAQLGNSATDGENVPSPVQILANGVKQVSAGSIHTCAVMVDSGRAKCWGANLDYYRSVFSQPHVYFPIGQLGNGLLDGNYADTPVDVVLPGGSPLVGVSQISAGYDETCAVLTGGVKCWGDNEHGQLGNNRVTNSASPVDVLEAPTAMAVPPQQMFAPTVSAGNGQVSAAFSAPADNGHSIAGYVLTASPGGTIATGTTSPIVMNGLTNGVTYTFTITASNSGGTSPLSTASAPVTPIAPVVLGSSPLFMPLAKPDRLLDNRNGPVGSSATVTVNNPHDGALLTVTVVDQVSDGFVTVWPCDTTMPNTSNVNYRVGPAIPNTVNITPAADGTVCVFSSTPIHVIIDQTGSWSKVSGFAGQVPDRLLDTRNLGPQTTTGVASGFDPSKAALVNVTVVDASDPGFVTVGPCSSGLPETSNLNFVGGETRAAAAIVKPDANGQVCVFSSVRAHLLLDRMGTLPLARVDTSHARRIIDTRNLGGLIAPGSTTLVTAGSSALFMNVTVVDAPADGYLTVYGNKAATRPDTSNVNYSAGNASSNTALVPVNNAVVVYASTGWKAIIDIQAEIT